MRLVLLCIGLTLLPTTSLAAESTKVVLYAPFGFGGLRSDFKVSSKMHGSCWIESLASSRPDAWRCSSANRIYDPCFR